MRSHRWRPKGKGWIRTYDRGSLVIWMKPEIDGLSIAIYNGEYQLSHENQNLAEVWLVRVPKNSHTPYILMDKPHKVWNLLTVHENEEYEYLEYRAIYKEVFIVPRSHYGHPRLNRKRKVFRRPLPPKIERALVGG